MAAAKYKVVKIFAKSRRRQVLERNLTEAEAQRVVKRYKTTKASIVVYFQQ